MTSPRSISVAGFSLGGTIAALVASRHPELVRAIICVDLDVEFDVAERAAYDTGES